MSRDWRDDAACTGVDPELFFPAGAPEDSFVSPSRVAQENTAKAICRVCPVRSECLEEALEGGTTTQYGIWGGMDERERRALKRQQARAAA